MTSLDQDDDCVSKKPWREVLNRSLKLFTFNLAREGGRSFGRVVFFVILGLIALFVATYILDSVTGWFGGWFDFWPFGSAAETTVPEKASWFDRFSNDTPPAPADEAKWYCKWNPLC